MHSPNWLRVNTPLLILVSFTKKNIMTFLNAHVFYIQKLSFIFQIDGEYNRGLYHG